ncbi:MAG: hypothetical protein K8I27_13845 [Planctomycetes bacterium]|nr:hypothetical protein [Planctomycetota bacterium]
MTVIIGLLALLTACPALIAQRHDAKARDITSREEYRGYRVEKPPGGGGSGQGGDGRGASDDTAVDGAGSGDGGTPRRETGSGGIPQRDVGSSGGGGGGSGGGLGLPGWIGAFFQVLAWIVVIAGALIALFFIVKALLGIKWKRKKKSEKSKKKRKEAPETETEAPEPTDDTFDEKVFGDALEIALRDYRDALAREDFAAATLLAYRVFWLRAGWKGCVEDADVRTWRDALRMVRQIETRRDVRELLPLVERVRYADHVPARQEFNDWSLKLERISPQGVL